MFNTLAICLVLFICNGVNSVSYITPCKWSDSDCIKKSSQVALPIVTAGIPELGVPVSDPLTINRLRSNAGGLDLTLTDAEVRGASQCKFEKVKRNIDKSSISFSVVCPLILKSQYTASGVLVFMPVEGNGDFGITAEKVKFNMIVKIDTETGLDGQEHWKIVSHEYNYDPLKKAQIKVENLFKGDKEKAEPVLQLIDSSWRAFLLEIGRPFVDQIVGGLVDNVNRFFSAVPTNELEVSEIYNR